MLKATFQTGQGNVSAHADLSGCILNLLSLAQAIVHLYVGSCGDCARPCAETLMYTLKKNIRDLLKPDMKVFDYLQGTLPDPYKQPLSPPDS